MTLSLYIRCWDEESLSKMTWIIDKLSDSRTYPGSERRGVLCSPGAWAAGSSGVRKRKKFKKNKPTRNVESRKTDSLIQRRPTDTASHNKASRPLCIYIELEMSTCTFFARTVSLVQLESSAGRVHYAFFK